MKPFSFLVIITIFLSGISLRAQRAIIDSMRRDVAQASTDSLRFDAYYKYTYRFGYRDSAAASLRVDTLSSYVPAETPSWYEARAVYLRSQIQRHHGDMANAKTTITEAIRLSRMSGDSNKVADYLHAKARLYLPAGAFDEALRLSQQAFDLYRQVDNPSGQVNTLNAMGLIQRQMGNKEEALAYYEKCYELGREHSHRKAFLGIISNLAIAHQNLERYDKAIALYREGLELAEKPPIQYRRRAYLQTNLAGLHQKREQYEASVQEMTKAYKFFEQQGSLKEKCAASWGLASSYFELHRYSDAIDFSRLALSQAGEQKQLRSQIHHLLSAAFKATGRPDSAITHLETYAELSQELTKEANDKSVAELEARFQNREQKLEIDRLATEDAAKATRLRQRSYIIGVTLMGLVLLGLLLWRNLRQRKLIENQNSLISRALKDKELLLKEIHHRVKNNLQMVSSLLNMQTHFIEDKAAADALQLGRSRVRSMALIHQKLYVGDTVSTIVDAKDYLERLAREVVDTHSPPGTDIDLQLDIAPLQMDIDLVVPLGLLTNEAVTNAVKYAYNNRTKGLLAIKLAQHNDEYVLTVKDDGPGINQSQDEEKNASFGQLLMQTLAEQLEGTLAVTDSGDGMQVILRFQSNA